MEECMVQGIEWCTTSSGWAGEPGREKWSFLHHSKSGHPITTQAATADGQIGHVGRSQDPPSGRLHYSAPNEARERGGASHIFGLKTLFQSSPWFQREREEMVDANQKKS